MSTITVDGKQLEIEDGALLLPALRAAGLELPALCYHPQLQAERRCSLCLVELSTAAEPAWRLAHSCRETVCGGLVVRTRSAAITETRAQAAALLLTRGPFRDAALTAWLTALVAEARAQGVAVVTPGEPLPDLLGGKHMEPGCILCGRCVEICRRAGKSRLTLLGRGRSLRVACAEGKDGADACGRCHACVSVCPTGFIQKNGESGFDTGLYK